MIIQNNNIEIYSRTSLGFKRAESFAANLFTDATHTLTIDSSSWRYLSQG